jgi:hypothetical protein
MVPPSNAALGRTWKILKCEIQSLNLSFMVRRREIMSSTINIIIKNFINKDKGTLSKFGFTFTTCVFRICLWSLPPPSLSFLLIHHEIASFDNFLFPTSLSIMLVLPLPVDLDLSLFFILDFFFHHFVSLTLNFYNVEVPPRSSLNYQEIFFSLRTVGIINHQTSRKARFHCS